nr:hypothetical protein [Bacillus licheniformis]
MKRLVRKIFLITAAIVAFGFGFSGHAEAASHSQPLTQSEQATKCRAPRRIGACSRAHAFGL